MLTRLITSIVLIIIYIVSVILSKHLLYSHFYLRCKNELFDKREDNIKRVCKEFMDDSSGIFYIPIINTIMTLILPLMILVEE